MTCERSYILGGDLARLYDAREGLRKAKPINIRRKREREEAETHWLSALTHLTACIELLEQELTR